MHFFLQNIKKTYVYTRRSILILHKDQHNMKSLNLLLKIIIRYVFESLSNGFYLLVEKLLCYLHTITMKYVNNHRAIGILNVFVVSTIFVFARSFKNRKYFIRNFNSEAQNKNVTGFSIYHTVPIKQICPFQELLTQCTYIITKGKNK